MTSVTRVSPVEARELVEQGYTYVDVRTVDEFVAQHPQGALNIPLALAGPSGSQDNPDFLPLMQRAFGPDAKIVVGCATGVRSLRAARLLLASGFTEIVDQRAGLMGARSPFGSLLEPGWAPLGLPVAEGDDAGSYAALKARLPPG